jgi:sugar phosphate permease
MDTSRDQTHDDKHKDSSSHQDIRGTRAFVLAGLSGGHGIFHWYLQSFTVALPSIKADLALTNLQLGNMIAIREFVSGIVNLPGGLLTDMFNKSWGLIMAGCMALLGISYIVIGAFPSYNVLMIMMAVIAIPPSIWHLPAMASLSKRFSRRRGLALGYHNVGGSLGDVVGPLLTGFLLGFVFWGNVFIMYGIPAVFIAFLVWWAFKPLGDQFDNPAISFKSQVKLTLQMGRNISLLMLTVVAGLRGAGHIGFVTFITIYLAEEAGMTSFWVGFHVMLITFLGMFSAPLLGLLSDIFSRKKVLVPSFFIEAFLISLLIIQSSGIQLSVTIALLGLFIFATQPMIMASALDIIGQDTAATSLGFLFTVRFLFAACSPIIAGYLYDSVGVDSVFMFIATLFFLAGVVMALVPFKGVTPQVRHRDHHGH